MIYVQKAPNLTQAGFDSVAASPWATILSCGFSFLSTSIPSSVTCQKANARLHSKLGLITYSPPPLIPHPTWKHLRAVNTSRSFSSLEIKSTLWLSPDLNMSPLNPLILTTRLRTRTAAEEVDLREVSILHIKEFCVIQRTTMNNQWFQLKWGNKIII